MFGAIFGKKALEDPEPFGLKRLSADDAPEMYPATTTEFAEAVESDTEEMAAIRPLLARTQLEERPLRLAYDAETDGWDAASFHAKVDSFGAAVVMAQTAGGAWVGGYNPRGWIGLGEDRNSIAAFLFTWPTGDLSQRAVKLPKAGGAALSVLDKPGTGPVFGADGLKILLQPGRERIASCKLGPYYEKLPGGGVSLFAEGENRKAAELFQLRVYVGEGGGEEWELDGIVWKTKIKDA